MLSLPLKSFKVAVLVCHAFNLGALGLYFPSLLVFPHGVILNPLSMYC